MSTLDTSAVQPARSTADLRRSCWRVRHHIIDMIYAGGSGHPGGSLSCTEILTTLYMSILRVDPAHPDWPDRDRFVLSKGHASPALYAVLAERGFIPLDWLPTFNRNGSRLQKHLDMHLVPGAEASTGSLGQGISMAVGMALAAKVDRSQRRVYVILGDGECQEGQVWEAAMAAAQQQLDNLIVYLDYNRLQTDGSVDDISSLEPIDERWRGSRWHVQHIDGHSIEQIMEATAVAQATLGQPHIVICDTVKGKGVSFMENRYEWHAQSLNEQTYGQAKRDLAAVEEAL